VVTAPTLIQQLHGKVDELRRMSDQLRQGDFLRQVIAQANDQSVWVRGPQLAFCGWIQALDAWMRNQFVGALDVVRQKIESYVRDFDNAQQAFANGIPGVALPPPPLPVGLTPPNCPYPFQMQVPKGTNPNMNPDLMRKGLGNAIGRAKEELHGFSIRLGDILTEPAPVPGAPVVPGAPPMRHLPPDAKEAAGIPKAYEAIGIELEKALRDVLERADAWEKVVEDELPTTTPDLAGAVAGIGASAGAAVVGAQDAVTDVTAVPTTPGAEAPAPITDPGPEKPPPTPEQVEAARQEGTRLAEEALKKDALNHPDELKKTADALAAHKDDPASEAFAAAFAEKFGAKNMLAVPRKLHAWQTGTGEPLKPKAGAFLQFEEQPPRPKDEDVQSILYAFSGTLATATQYDDFNTDVEDDILSTDDQLALSWLLANPDADFDADFLVKAFDRGVKDVLLKEANLTGIGGYGKGEVPLQLVGTKLDSDPKLAVLDAISRNPEAAMRIADIEFKPPLTIPMGVRPAVKVNNVVELLYNGGNTTTGYGDKGAAIGRLFDTAHRGFCEGGDARNAQELVDQILHGATNEKNVKAAQPYLAKIGSRHPTDGPAAQAALDRVRDDPKQPGRELLLSQLAQVNETAKSFAEAAFTASKNKVKESKSPELRALRETEGAWNVIPTLQQDPSTANLAQTLTEQGIHEAVEGELSDEARRGLARAITADAAGFASSVTILARAQKGGPAPEHSAELEGIQINADEFAACVADLMKDPEARRTVEAGAGNLTGAWAGQAASSYIDDLLGNPWDKKRTQLLDNQSAEMGNYLCAVIKGSTKAAENKAQAAVDALQGMRIGANIFSMGIDFASGFVPGGGALKAGGKFLFDKAIDTVKGGTGVEGLPLGLEGGLTGVMDDEIKSQEDSAWAKAKVEVNDALPLAREFVRDSMAGGLLQEAIHRPSPGREQALDQLGVQPEALQAAGLLDQSGNVKIPLMGTPEYTNYTNFLAKNPALAGAVEKASAGVADNFTDCMTDALIVKNAGK
jgi:hypothetical protein